MNAKDADAGPKIEDSFEEFKRAAKRKAEEKYVLRLYISGMTSRSLEAIENLRKICDEQLSGCYDLQVVDISQQPESVTRADIIATPTLIKELPKPIRRIIGDLSDKDRIIIALNLQPKKNE